MLYKIWSQRASAPQELLQGLQRVTAFWQRLIAQEARRLPMAQDSFENKLRRCCDSDYIGTHLNNCPSSFDKVDKTKLRNIIRDKLNKLSLGDEGSVKNLLKMAEEIGITNDDIPLHPQTPADYHDEPGRPHFGPLQVRHASDLEKGENYFCVSAGLLDQHPTKVMCKFEGFMFFEENENLDSKNAGWYIKLTPLTDMEKKTYYEWNIKSLWSISLHPWLGGLSEIKHWREWSDNNMWLEFLPKNVDTCMVALHNSLCEVCVSDENDSVDSAIRNEGGPV